MNKSLKYFCSALAVFMILLASCRVVYGQQTDTLVIHFDFGRSLLRPDARTAIDNTLSRFDPRGKIVLSGYCDSIGGNSYNDRLSLSRVLSTRDYLRSKGLPDSLISGMNAYGKKRPLNDNSDTDKRTLNRRVEIVFVYPAPSTQAALPSPPSSPQTNLPSPRISLTEFFRDSAHAGKTYVLRNLNFVSGRHVLMPYSDTVLKELLHIMLDSPDLKIEIRGHVCCIAEWLDGLDMDTNTNDLSVRRAGFVYTYLRQRGVKASRMSYKGYGASMKLYPEERNEQEQEWNRRVEIKVISRGHG